MASASWKDANRKIGKRHGTAETRSAYTIRPPRVCPQYIGRKDGPCAWCGQYHNNK